MLSTVSCWLRERESRLRRTCPFAPSSRTAQWRREAIHIATIPQAGCVWLRVPCSNRGSFDSLRPASTISISTSSYLPSRASTSERAIASRTTSYSPRLSRPSRIASALRSTARWVRHWPLCPNRMQRLPSRTPPCNLSVDKTVRRQEPKCLLRFDPGRRQALKHLVRPDSATRQHHRDMRLLGSVAQWEA